MKQNIDFSNNIKSSLVVKSVASEEEKVTLKSFLLTSGVDHQLMESLPKEVSEALFIPELSLVASPAFNFNNNCANFNYEVYDGFFVEGNICITGRINLKIKAFGAEIEILDTTINGDGICNKINVSGFITVVTCFKLKNNCLYTTGKIETPFGVIGKWDEEVLCLG